MKKAEAKAQAVSKFQVRGEVEFSIFENGVLKTTVKQKNLIVNLGYNTMTSRLSEVAANLYITQIGYGTGTTPVDITDTGITGAFIKALDGHSFPVINKVQFDWSLDYSENNGVDVSEFALFSEDGTTMFSKIVRPPISKNSSIRLEGTWTIIF